MDFSKIDPMAVLTAAGPILVALFGGWATYVIGKKKASSDAQAAVQQGFQMLVTQLQDERVKLTAVVDRQTGIIEKQDAKIVGLELGMRDLVRHVLRLETMIIKLGGEPPEMPNSNRS